MSEKISEKFKSSGTRARVSIISHKIEIVSQSYKMSLNFLFIPQSLEKQIVKALLSFIKLSRKELNKLRNADPHKALNELAKHLGLNDYTELCKIVVENNLLDKEDWYKNFVQQMKKFLG